MSLSSTAGALALVAVLFVPGSFNAGSVGLLTAPPKAGVGAGGVVLPILDAHFAHCGTEFGPTSEGWAAHRHWQACPAAGNEDRPHVSEYLRGGPHFYLNTYSGEQGPHDDF